MGPFSRVNQNRETDLRVKKGVKGWAGGVFRFQDERNIFSRSCALRGRRSCRDERRWERWAGSLQERFEETVAVSWR